jgi:transcriptional regulator with XRE-family HTH domain
MTSPGEDKYKYYGSNDIYTFFSTPQRDLAILLGVSQSQVAKYYRGERNLPGPARAMLKSLIDVMNEADKIEVGPEVFAESGTAKVKAHRIYLAESRLASLKKKLAAMEEKYKQALITLYKLPKLEIKVPDELKENFETWIQLVNLNSDIKRLKNSPHKQRSVRRRIAMLEVKIRDLKGI